MQLEEVQAIWETQIAKPVFALNDFGLHMALYQTRDRARRRLFWGNHFPFFVGSLFLLGALALIFLAFLFQAPGERFPMNAWDGLAILVGAMATLIAASSMYASRRNHEQNQNVFAPSLRQEIERGIAQVEFEISTQTGPLVRRNAALMSLGGLGLLWGGVRLNGAPLQWESLWPGETLWPVLFFALLVSARFLFGIPANRRRKEKELLPRKRALEALRAKLDENPPTGL